MFNIRGAKLIATALGGGLGWTLNLLLQFVINDEAVRYFIVAMLISLYAEAMARLMKAPATVFIAPSLIPLVPGASLYYTMAYALDGGGAAFTERATATVTLAASLAIGVIVSAVIMRIYLKVVALIYRKNTKGGN